VVLFWTSHPLTAVIKYWKGVRSQEIRPAAMHIALLVGAPCSGGGEACSVRMVGGWVGRQPRCHCTHTQVLRSCLCGCSCSVEDCHEGAAGSAVRLPGASPCCSAARSLLSRQKGTVTLHVTISCVANKCRGSVTPLPLAARGMGKDVVAILPAWNVVSKAHCCRASNCGLLTRCACGGFYGHDTASAQPLPADFAVCSYGKEWRLADA
jgi:hypothetical protein